jgi:hypothetical protein
MEKGWNLSYYTMHLGNNIKGRMLYLGEEKKPLH